MTAQHLDFYSYLAPNQGTPEPPHSPQWGPGSCSPPAAAGCRTRCFIPYQGWLLHATEKTVPVRQRREPPPHSRSQGSSPPTPRWRRPPRTSARPRGGAAKTGFARQSQRARRGMGRGVGQPRRPSTATGVTHGGNPVPWLGGSAEPPPPRAQPGFTQASPSQPPPHRCRALAHPPRLQGCPSASRDAPRCQPVTVPTSNARSVSSTSFYLTSFSPPRFSANPLSLLCPYTPNLRSTSPRVSHFPRRQPPPARLPRRPSPGVLPHQPHPAARVAQRGHQQPRDTAAEPDARALALARDPSGDTADARACWPERRCWGSGAGAGDLLPAPAALLSGDSSCPPSTHPHLPLKGALPALAAF